VTKIASCDQAILPYDLAYTQFITLHVAFHDKVVHTMTLEVEIEKTLKRSRGVLAWPPHHNDPVNPASSVNDDRITHGIMLYTV